MPPSLRKAMIGDAWIHPVYRSQMVYVPAGEFVTGMLKNTDQDIGAFHISQDVLAALFWKHPKGLSTWTHSRSTNTL